MKSKRDIFLKWNKIVDPTAAFHCKDLETSMRMVFPDEWDTIIARILETGAYFHEKFAPRWTVFPLLYDIDY